MAAKTKRAQARPANEAEAPPVVITRGWTLAELPSPQHRAGLAGLAIMVAYTNRFTLPEGAVLAATHCDDVRYEVRLNRGV